VIQKQRRDRCDECDRHKPSSPRRSPLLARCRKRRASDVLAPMLNSIGHDENPPQCCLNFGPDVDSKPLDQPGSTPSRLLPLGPLPPGGQFRHSRDALLTRPPRAGRSLSSCGHPGSAGAVTASAHARVQPRASPNAVVDDGSVSWARSAPRVPRGRSLGSEAAGDSWLKQLRRQITGIR
jgi:hypothetical protein